MSDKMEVNEGQDDRYDDNESEEIDPGNDNLQIDESEDVDVTEPDNKIPRMDPENYLWAVCDIIVFLYLRTTVILNMNRLF